MAEPTLSEINSFAVDPELGTGTPAHVIDNRELVRNITQAALYKAENDKWKYNTFLNEVNNIYKDVGNLAEMDVATQDLPELKKQFSEVLGEVYKDPREFFSGVGNQKRQIIQQKLAELKKNSVESKMNRTYDAAHREYIARNPDMNNDENKAKIDAFWKSPLGQRQPYTLDISNPFDPYALSKIYNEQVKSDYARTGLSPDNKFIVEEKGTIYDPQKYSAIAAQGYDLPGAKGQQIRSSVEKYFNKLPDEVKAQYGNDPKQFYTQTIEGLRKQNEVKDSGLKVNPYGLEVLENKNKVALEYLKDRLDKQTKPEQSGFLLNYASTLFNNTTGDKLTVDLGKGQYSTEDVLSATPELLKIFGKAIKKTTKSTDLLGEESVSETEQSRPPDALTRTTDGKLRTLFYKHDENGNIVKINGKPVTDSYEVIPANEVMAIVGKNFMDKKSLPGAVTHATDILNQHGGNILNYNQQNTPPEKEAPVAERIKESTKFSVKGKSYSMKQLKDLGYTDDQINQAIQAGTIKKQ